MNKTKEKFNDFNIFIKHLSRIIKDNYISLKLTHIRHEPQSMLYKIDIIVIMILVKDVL